MNDLKNIENLLNHVDLIVKKHEQFAEYTGENFNVFNVLGVQSSELSHSAFIANLLNPKEKHDQKEVFLQLFINQLIETYKEHVAVDNTNIEILENFDIKNTNTIIEKHIGEVTHEDGGRIDILLGDGKYQIVIENKI